VPAPDALIERFDPSDPAFVADPYPVLAGLREATPIFYNERSRQWVLTRFADVHAMLRDRRLGRVYTHRYTHAELGRPEPDARWAAFDEHERWSLLQLEPPDHTRIRRLIAKVFTPTAAAAVRPAATALAVELLDGCRQRGRFDLLADYAQPYSVAVICSILGVPRADTHLLLDWSHAIVKMYELTTSDEQRAEATRAAQEFMDYTAALIGDKRRRPDGLLVSALAAVEDDGDRLSDPEIISTVIVLLNAGHEATVNATGNGWWALFRNPDQLERLRADHSLIPRAVEELLRFDTPLQMFERWVLEDVEILGQRIPRGSELGLLFGSANHDPEVFAEPSRLDVGRDPNPHVTFGAGIHFCLGAPLARVELETSFRTILENIPRLELVEEPRWKPGYIIRGLESLLVRG
jgi:cytochrome P450